MQINKIEQLENANKIIPKINEWYSGINYIENLKQTCSNANVDFNNCIIYAVNIFLDKHKNKYKNVKPLKCVIKHGDKFYDHFNNTYCLILLEHDIWTKNFRYSYVRKINDVLNNIENSEFPNLALYTTKLEAYNHIDNYRKENDLNKHKERLSRINIDLKILTEEKQKLEKIIKEYESNN